MPLIPMRLRCLAVLVASVLVTGGRSARNENPGPRYEEKEEVGIDDVDLDFGLATDKSDMEGLDGSFETIDGSFDQERDRESWVDAGKTKRRNAWLPQVDAFRRMDGRWINEGREPKSNVRPVGRLHKAHEVNPLRRHELNEPWEVVPNTPRKQRGAIRISAVSWNAGNHKLSKSEEGWSDFLKDVLTYTPKETDLLVIGLQELAGDKEYESFVSHLGLLIGQGNRTSHDMFWHHNPTSEANLFCRGKFWTAIFAISLHSDWKIDRVHPKSKHMDCNKKQGGGCNTGSKWRECGKVENFLFLTASQEGSNAEPIKINLLNTHLSFKGEPEERMSRINNALHLSRTQSEADVTVFVGDFNSRFQFPSEANYVPSNSDEFEYEDEEKPPKVWDLTTEELLHRFKKGLGIGYEYWDDGKGDELAHFQTRQNTWREPEVPTFLPTYKLMIPDRGYVDDKNTKHKPAYTDRVILWNGDGISTRTRAYEAIRIGPKYGSDHDPVLATIDVSRLW